MPTHTIMITAQDILNGVRDDCFRCPIARALVRYFPNSPQDLGVGQDVIYQRQSLRIVDLPIEAQVFIAQFDEGTTVAPFSFTVEDRDQIL